ncbi:MULTISPECIES: toxin [Streptomyces]|uniref:toxin n=1 Tax=Streptomyces TaxID=1883 RepID=UPI00146FB285|nr:toxin [Streptomyces glaucescens]
MSTRAMKALLAYLGKEASKIIQRPADPPTVMHGFCQAMSVRRGRPVQLALRAFPDDIPVSGMRIDCGDRSIIVVEERAVPESQLVILGHELWHEEQGECPHHIAGLPAATRAFAGRPTTPDLLRRAAEAILAAQEVPRHALLAVAGRAESADDHEVDAETFGLLFGREVRAWMAGRHARGPVNPTTVEGRINLSLSHRGGQILG